MSDSRQALQLAIEANLPKIRTLRVLDAGCGGRQQVLLSRSSHWTGIDISTVSLSRFPNLDERLVGDIQSFPFEKDRYDLVICWNVLEHLLAPDIALNNLYDATARLGLLVVAFPNPMSLKGLITRFTPHFVHVLAMRLIFGHEKAGRPGYAPYKTYLRFVLIPSRLKRFCAERGMRIVYLRTYEGSQAKYVKTHYPVLYYLYRSLDFAIHVLSLGYVAHKSTDVHVLIMKPPASVRATRDVA